MLARAAKPDISWPQMTDSDGIAAVQTAEAPPAAAPNGEPLVRAEGVWKVFGPHGRPHHRHARTPSSRAPSCARRRAAWSPCATSRSTIWPGEVFVVMGLSGSGKSTLVRTLIRLIEPTAGRDHDHRPRRDGRRRRASCASCAATPSRWCSSTSACSRTAGDRQRRLRARDPGRAEGRAPRARERDAPAWSASRTSRTSSPTSSRAACSSASGLARAFAVDPKLMLYDEPFSALDPLIRRDMQDEVCRLQDETGKTMLFITHDLPEALRLGDRIAIMRDGAIVQLGTPEELVGSPADDYVANFVRDIPRTHVLTLRWIMRDPRPGEETDGPGARRAHDRPGRRAGGRGHRRAGARRRGRARRGRRRPRDGAPGDGRRARGAGGSR